MVVCVEGFLQLLHILLSFLIQIRKKQTTFAASPLAGSVIALMRNAPHSESQDSSTTFTRQEI